jgi:hypothetical protein
MGLCIPFLLLGNGSINTPPRPRGTVGGIVFQCDPSRIKRKEAISSESESESESYVTTDGQSASLSWYKAPIRGLRPDFYFHTEYV